MACQRRILDRVREGLMGQNRNASAACAVLRAAEGITIEHPGIDRWISGFRTRDPTLTSSEEMALRGLLSRGLISEALEIAGDQDVGRIHERMTQSHRLLEGWALRYMPLGDGLRQIVAIHIPGDFVGLYSAHWWRHPLAADVPSATPPAASPPALLA